jgi:hypothetical protein
MLEANPALSCKDGKSVLQKGNQNRGVLVLYRRRRGRCPQDFSLEYSLYKTYKDTEVFPITNW